MTLFARLLRFVSEALRLLYARRFKTLIEKMTRLSLRAGPVVSAGALMDALGVRQQWVLLLDSAQGGGASDAAAVSAQHWLAQGSSVLRLGATSLGSLNMTLMCPGSASPVLAGRLKSLADLEPLSPTQIEAHTFAGFADAVAIAAWLAAMAARGADLQVHWHEHFMICPTRHLLSSAHQYCGLPAIDHCASCLPDNPHCVDPRQRQRSMQSWREDWQQLLSAASLIRVFSESSATLIRQVWPTLATPISVVPHKARDESLAPLVPPIGVGLRIAVVGRIGLHKGANRVSALARLIEARGDEASITVVGTLESPASSRVVHETGAYQPRDLLPLCRDHRINVFWMPSVWPETFSFVVHEMMAMGLPILAYDVGAQAEYLAQYPQARLVPLDASASEVLTALSELVGQS